MADERTTYPRLALWLDFFKVVFVSGIAAAVIAIVPHWLNKQIQDTQLEMKKAEQESKIKEAIINQEKRYVQEFLDRATEANVERRYMFTQYVSALARDPDLHAP